MSRGKSSDLLVFAGVGLIVLGAWALFDHILAPLMQPVAALLGIVGHAAWPLALILIGVMLVTRARSGANVAPGNLYRSRTDRVIGGVLGGLAAKLGVDAAPLRIVFALLTFFGGGWAGLVLYALAMALLPEEPIAAGAHVAPAPPVPVASVAPAPPAPSTPGN